MGGTGNESVVGTYTRVGSIVYVGAFINFGIQTATSQLEINAFPFDCGGSTADRAGLNLSYNTASTYYSLLMDTSSAKARFWKLGTTGPTVANLSNRVVHFGGTYRID